MSVAKFLHVKQLTAKPTKYPIVLCHGLSGFDSLQFLRRPQFWRKNAMKKVIRDSLIKIDYWYGIQDHLKQIGCETYVSKVPAFGTIDERAKGLNDYLDHILPDLGKKEVNLIAHSMGGLDARYLISKLKNKNFQVKSLTTVSTPHHGSEVADFVIDHMNFPVLVSKAVPQLTTYYMEKFNQQIQNDPDVAYFSYGAQFKPHWYNVFHYPHSIIKRRVLRNGGTHWENDGLVSVESAKWGEYLGTLDGVDHLDLINWTNRLRSVFDSMVNRKEQFDALHFYSHIVNDLYKRGF